MVYVKSVMVGIVTGLVAAAIWIFVTLVVPIALPLLLSRVIDDGTGIGAGFGFVDSRSIMGIALVGFIVGFFWRLRRSPKTATGRGSK